MIKTIKVSEKGQIALPQSMRAILGIDKGDELIAVQMQDKILLQKVQSVEQKLKDDFKDVLKLNEKSLNEVWDNKEDERWNKFRRNKK
ncbi:MAG: AbrB/MazE/SpoVT family DNA-binding domain-containing protein [Candidatus Woesearchaeota archaeon]